MATFYFNGAADVAAELPADWQTLGNWWMSYDAETNTHSVPATSLPTSADSIEVRGAGIDANSGSEPTVVNATFFGPWPGGYLSISMTATGLFTFNDGSSNNGTITGDCTFNDSSKNYDSIIGDCTFNDSSQISYNYGGSIIGDCTFNDSSKNYNDGGSITGDCTFNDSSFNYNEGNITGDCTFNDSSYNYGSIYSYGTITGDCTFNDSSYNNGGTITGDATFKDSSYNSANGTVSGSEVYSDRTPYPIPRGINGSSILGVI